MNQPLCDLRKLQALDDQVGCWRAVATGGPMKLTAARENLTALEQAVADLDQAVEASRLRHGELEREVLDLSDKKQRNQAKHMRAKTNEELRALFKESDHLAREIGIREDELLALLDRLEKLELEKPDMEARLTEEALAYGRKAEEIETALAEGLAREQEALAAREALAREIPPLLLDQYDRLFKGRGGTAVAQVAQGTCQACRLAVPPQVYNELQRNEKIITCPNCNRIIYWRDHPDFQESAD